MHSVIATSDSLFFTFDSPDEADRYKLSIPATAAARATSAMWEDRPAVRVRIQHLRGPLEIILSDHAAGKPAAKPGRIGLPAPIKPTAAPTAPASAPGNLVSSGASSLVEISKEPKIQVTTHGLPQNPPAAHPVSTHPGTGTNVPPPAKPEKPEPEKKPEAPKAPVAAPTAAAKGTKEEHPPKDQAKGPEGENKGTGE